MATVFEQEQERTLDAARQTAKETPKSAAERDALDFFQAVNKTWRGGEDGDLRVMIERLKNQTINLGLLGDLCLLPLLRINNRNRARQVQIDALEKRIVELEARPVSGVQYGGIYDDKKAYTSGQLVTRSGGLWLALSGSTGERPGTSPAWKLIVKSGSDRPVGDTR